MAFFNRSISHRFLAVFGMVGVLILGAVTIGHRGISASVDELRRVAAQDMHHERIVSGMVSGFKKQVQEWKNVLLRGADPQQLNKYWGKFRKQEKQIQESGRNLLAGMSPSDARDQVDEFLRAHREMGVAYRAGFEAFVNAGHDPTVGDKAVKGIDRAPTQLLEDAAAQIANIAHEASDTALDGASSASLTALLATLATLLAGVGASAFFLHRFLLVPMCRVVSGLDKLADGDFKVDIDSRRQDELGQLARSARRIRDDLGGVLQKIVATAHELDASGKSLAELSELNRGQLDVQQGGTSQVATAMDQLVAAAREVAAGAAGAADAATNVEGSIASGAQVVGQAIASINHLEQDVEKVHQELNALEGHSDAIGNVLDVIRGIAEQTNLLALNAAIEAARAGEQGRGFAVVADEVRSLAKRTQESTQEIQQTIEQLQGGARAAVASMEHGRTRVNEGVARTCEVEHALEEITAAVTTIVEMNTQIATAAEEQGEVARTVSGNVTRIDGSSSKMVASAESVAQTSRNIADLAYRLREATLRFHF